MSIPTNYQNLSGFRTSYSETELRLAIAIAEAFIENSLGGGGGGGSGITQAEVKTAIEVADNLNDLATDATLQQVRDRLMPSGTTTPYLGSSAGANLKSSAGTIYAVTCSNFNTAIRYFQVFNKATAPVLNDVPIRCFPVLPNEGLLILGQEILGGSGIELSTGVSWGFSTTRLWYTSGIGTDCICTVRWQ